MPTQEPTVSVIIPTYNRADMLGEALQSVVRQTVPVASIIVVDDGSTDHTPDVVAQFRRDGAPISILEGEHRDRLGEARNRGVQAARSDWVAFLDSDDVWLPQRIEKQIAAIRAMPEAGFAFCNVQRFDHTGAVGGPFLPKNKEYSGYITGELLLEPVALPSALMIKREVFIAHGGFSMRPINEDYELTLLLSLWYPASYVSEVLVRMRKHEGSRSLARQKQANIEYIRIVRAFLTNTDLPRDVMMKGRLGLANVHYKLARLYIAEGKNASARRHLDACLRLRPLNRRFLLAHLAFRIGKWTVQ